MRFRFFKGVIAVIAGIILFSGPLSAIESSQVWSGINPGFVKNRMLTSPTGFNLCKMRNWHWTLSGSYAFSSELEENNQTEVDSQTPVHMDYVIIALSKMDMNTHPEDVRFYSNREGTRVMLEKVPLVAGAPDIAGETIPLPLVEGNISIMDYRIYEFEASLSGYETIQDRIVVTPGEFRKLSYTMVPRLDNRSGALWRSAVLPGWGQRYNGHQYSAWVIHIAQIASVAFSAYAYIDYRNKHDDYDQARDEYLNAVGSSEINRRKIEVEDARNTLHDAAYLVDYAFAITGGIYAVNLLDVAFLGGGKVKVASGWKSGS